MYYILLFIHNQYILCNGYCNTNTYESAYMYTVECDTGRIAIYVTHNNKRSVLPHPLICIMLLSTP